MMIATRHAKVEEVFKQVRAAVRRASNNQQTPWENPQTRRALKTDRNIDVKFLITCLRYA